MINLKKEDMCNKSNVVSDDEHYNNEKIIDNDIGDNHAVNNLSECSSTPDDYERIFIVDESVNDDTMFSVTFYDGVTEDIKFSQIVDSCQNHLEENDENYVDSIVRK